MAIPLPTYEMVIDENPESEVEVSFVALVDKPAIERNFLAFSKDGQFVKPSTGESKEEFLPRCMKVLVGEGKENPQAYAICNSLWDNKGMNMRLDFAINEQRQIISGPAMVADTLIYRKDAGGEYNVFFSKDTIEKIALKFFKQDYQKNLNLFHDPTLSLQGVTIFESFVSDKSRGVQPMKGFEDLPDGTWFISAKVENPNVWAKIQSGEVKGFSVEGIFSYMKKPKDAVQELEEVLNRTLEDSGHIYPNGFIMSKVKDFIANIKKELFDGTPLAAPIAPVLPAAPAPTQQTMNDYKTKDGMAVSVDKLEVGGTALMNGVPAPAGEFELEDGTKLTVGEGGVITAVTPGIMSAAPALTMAEVEGMITKAITAYKEQMQQAQLLSKLEAAEKMLSDHKTTMAAQDKKIAGLFEICEKLAELPTGDPVGDNHTNFSTQKVKSKEEYRANLIEMFRKKKEAK